MIASLAAVTATSERVGTADTDTSTSPTTVVRLPRVGTSVALTAAVMVSSAPSLLPRPAVTQALFTGVLMASALGVVWAARRAVGRPRPTRLRRRAWTAGVGTLLSVGALCANILWQNRLRVAMDVDTVNWMYAVDVVGGAAGVALALCGLCRVVVKSLGALGGSRTMIVIAVIGLLSCVVAAPAVRSAVSDSLSASNSAVDDAVTAPSSSTRSGGPHSLVPWRTLGREGRKFASGGLDPGTIRTYVGLDSAPTLDERVELVVADMERAGAFQRSVVVVAIPTGSGWVDENAVAGAESRFGGDVATVALQYSNKPSWATFLFAEDDARRSAEAVVRGIARAAARAATESTPPSIVVYGQSLGAVAGNDAYLSLRQSERSICGAVWAGPPAGAVNASDATVLANSSDPVVQWSADLLWSPPSTDATRRDAPTPIWLPIVSFVQTSVDLAAALDVDAGHGHRYGIDQGTTMPRCR